MVVEATGRSATGTPVRARWCLVAKGGVGPTIPALPAVVLVNRLGPLADGAWSAAGLVPLGEMMSHLNRLGIDTEMTVEDTRQPEVFRQALGSAWQVLPQITRDIHMATPSIRLVGEAAVLGAENRAGALIARLFGFPEAGQRVPVPVIVESDGVRERWARHYPTRVMKSVMASANGQASTVEEWLGPFTSTSSWWEVRPASTSFRRG
jgi:hypothetical protein